MNQTTQRDVDPDFNVTNLISLHLFLNSTSSLFHNGDVLNGLYLINSGLVRLSRVLASGEEHVIRFCTAGDLVGLEVLREGVSETNAVVLDSAAISFIPLAYILERGRDKELSALMDRIDLAMALEQQHRTIDFETSSSERIACFFSDYLTTLELQGLVQDSFIMPMCSSEIALYLGLETAEVCATLEQFNVSGLLITDDNRVEIPDFSALHAFAKTAKTLH